MSRFAELGVPADLVATLQAAGITHPFPIQEDTLPVALTGRDLCGRAPTGSGKTIAFSIPLVCSVGRAQPKRPEGLVLVPTRELAAQVLEVIEPLARARDLRVTSIYGGVGFGPQLDALKRGVDIVVACPGRLLDLIGQGAVRLDAVKVAVVDEADRMADMGFLPSVRRLLDQTKKDRQTLLFSATLDGDVDVLIKRYQRDPSHHEVHTVEEEEDNTVHLFWSSPRSTRADLCGDILRRTGSTIVFTRTKHRADRLAHQLSKDGFATAAIHGGRSQPQRDRALAAFSAGRVQALVATDVAARGIHVDGVDCVIHYDVPEDEKAYVHRSGRTARAGATGTVVTLVENDERHAVTRMQRRLQMAAGVIDPDFRGLPEQEPWRRSGPEPRGDATEAAKPPARKRRRHAAQGRPPRGRGRMAG